MSVPEGNENLPAVDPEFMTVEDDGTEVFDQMWNDGETVTPDGYLHRPLQ